MNIGIKCVKSQEKGKEREREREKARVRAKEKENKLFLKQFLFVNLLLACCRKTNFTDPTPCCEK